MKVVKSKHHVTLTNEHLGEFIHTALTMYSIVQIMQAVK